MHHVLSSVGAMAVLIVTASLFDSNLFLLILGLFCIPVGLSALATYSFFAQRMFRRVRSLRWYTLDLNALKIGDIVATRDDTSGSRRIQKITGGRFSHVALYLGDGVMCEAVPPRARLVLLRHHVFTTGKGNFAVYRLASNTLNEHKVISEAKFYAWNLYSLAKAAGLLSPFLRKFSAKDANICSELVVEVYSRSGVNLFANAQPGHISPKDITESPLLRNVTADVRTECSPEIAETYFKELFGASGPLKSSNLVRWFTAAVYALLPLRSGWAKAMKEWNQAEFWAFYIFSALPIFWGATKQTAAWPRVWLFRLYRRFGQPPSDEVRAQALSFLKGVIHSLEQETLLQAEHYATLLPHLSVWWQRRFTGLSRANTRLRDRAITLAKREIRFYTSVE
jgi:hypothetical protein